MEKKKIFSNEEVKEFKRKAFQVIVQLKEFINPYRDKVLKNKSLIRTFRLIFISFVTFVTISFLFIFLVYLVPQLQEISMPVRKYPVSKDLAADAGYKKEIKMLNSDVQRLTRKYNAYTSGQSYIVINTTENRFNLYRNKKLVREGFCSSGSYTLLQTEGDKHWIFKTPKGKYKILGKTTNPVWKRPDWAFVEEGLPIPPAGHPSRYEYGVLGDYSLALGDGYLIHGTLYKRFLGMPVTHGCVRLNDEDLEIVFNTLSIGSKVYIF